MTYSIQGLCKPGVQALLSLECAVQVMNMAEKSLSDVDSTPLGKLLTDHPKIAVDCFL